MQRRDFMIFSAVTGVTSQLGATASSPQQKFFAEVKETIAAVQGHMFPPNGPLPSADEMRTIDFTEATIFHPTYDKDIRNFVLEGAKELMLREEKFLSYTAAQKEKALRAYEKTGYGSNWLSRIMVLTMEALFSDPVYGSNIQEAGWKSLKSFGGEPRPKTRYIEL